MFRSLLYGTALLAVSLAAPAFADGHSKVLTLSSPDIAEGQQLNPAQVFQGFGCEGGNAVPTLTWAHPPEGTESFAITVYDPDAPTGSGWWHWFAFNIPADVMAVSADSPLPETAIQLTNDYGATGFGGACPPPGEVHRYQFTIHALPKMLDIDGSVSNALAGFMVNANRIGSASITAVYNR